MKTANAMSSLLGFGALLVIALAPHSTVKAQAYSEASLLQVMAARTDSGPPLRAMKRDGYLAQRPLVRADYDDFYKPKKPLTILGSRVVLVSENYYLRDIGCCVDQGISLYFELPLGSDQGRIREFSDRYDCKVKVGVEDIYIIPQIRSVFRSNRQYVHMKCSGTR
jgi:hypothetical protein